MTNRPAITEDQLRAAFKRERPYRQHWPETFEAAIVDPLIYHALLAFARANIPTFARRAAPRAGNLVPQSRTPWNGPHIAPPLAPGETDRKRAASGDDTDKE
jgi:hypothetical protein